MHEAAGALEMQALQPPQAPDWRRGEDLEAFITALSGSSRWRRARSALFSAHQMGTCRMGSDPETSVADP